MRSCGQSRAGVLIATDEDWNVWVVQDAVTHAAQKRTFELALTSAPNHYQPRSNALGIFDDLVPCLVALWGGEFGVRDLRSRTQIIWNKAFYIFFTIEQLLDTYHSSHMTFSRQHFCMLCRVCPCLSVCLSIFSCKAPLACPQDWDIALHKFTVLLKRPFFYTYFAFTLNYYCILKQYFL